MECDGVPTVGGAQPEVIRTDRTHLADKQAGAKRLPISRSEEMASSCDVRGRKTSDCNSFPASAVGFGTEMCQPLMPRADHPQLLRA